MNTEKAVAAFRACSAASAETVAALAVASGTVATADAARVKKVAIARGTVTASGTKRHKPRTEFPSDSTRLRQWPVEVLDRIPRLCYKRRP